MPSSRALHWQAAAVCTVPVAVAAAALLVGGVTNVAPPVESPQVIDTLVAATTTTTLTASPVSPIVQGSPVTLTATITPSTAVGTVQFKDGANNLGNAVPVSSNGTASGSTTMLAAGLHQLTAVFTPTDQATFTPSTSASVPVTIAAPGGAAGAAGAAATSAATATGTELATSPASAVAAGSPLTLTAMITPATAVGTVQFRDGTTNLGNPVIVSNGTASGTTSTLTPGSHQLTAVFTPTNPAVFSPSTSSAVPVTVVGAGGGASQALTTQQSGLSLDIRLSILGDQTCDLDGGRSLLNVSMPVLDDRGTVVAGRLSVLDGGSVLDDRRGLLGGVVTVVLG